MRAMRFTNLWPLAASLALALACGGNSLFSGDHGSGSTAEEKRPTDEGEGVPGYLVDPAAVSMNRGADGATFGAPKGSVMPGTLPLGSLRIAFIQIPTQTLKEALEASGSSYEVKGSLLGSAAVAEDGSFRQSLAVAGDDPVVVRVTDAQVSGTFALRAAKRLQNAYVDVSKDVAQGRAFASPNLSSGEDAGPTTVTFLTVRTGSAEVVETTLRIFVATGCDPAKVPSSGNCADEVSIDQTPSDKHVVELKAGAYAYRLEAKAFSPASGTFTVSPSRGGFEKTVDMNPQ